MHQNSVIKEENKQRGRNTKPCFFFGATCYFILEICSSIHKLKINFFKLDIRPKIQPKINVKLETIHLRFLIDSR